MYVCIYIYICKYICVYLYMYVSILGWPLRPLCKIKHQ